MGMLLAHWSHSHAHIEDQLVTFSFLYVPSQQSCMFVLSTLGHANCSIL